MSEFAQEWPPVWFHDISSALALSKQAEPERRLQDFLATLSAETLRLAVFETTEAAGEALAYATACISALFNDSSAVASDDDFLDRLTPRVSVMLILEGLQRRGYVGVDWGDALDPMAMGAAGPALRGSAASAATAQHGGWRSIPVMVRRWQDYSGKKATLEGGGRTFEGIAEQRLGQNAERPAAADAGRAEQEAGEC